MKMEINQVSPEERRSVDEIQSQRTDYDVENIMEEEESTTAVQILPSSRSVMHGFGAASVEHAANILGCEDHNILLPALDHVAGGYNKRPVYLPSRYRNVTYENNEYEQHTVSELPAECTISNERCRSLPNLESPEGKPSEQHSSIAQLRCRAEHIATLTRPSRNITRSCHAVPESPQTLNVNHPSRSFQEFERQEDRHNLNANPCQSFQVLWRQEDAQRHRERWIEVAPRASQGGNASIVESESPTDKNSKQSAFVAYAEQEESSQSSQDSSRI